MTLRSLMREPSVFKAGVAIAPVTGRAPGYDTGYTERYMGTPASNPDGYKDSSVIEATSSLSGHLLVIHGMLDENVHFPPLRPAGERLIAAGRPVRIPPRPVGARHSSRKGPREDVHRGPALGIFRPHPPRLTSVAGAMRHFSGGTKDGPGMARAFSIGSICRGVATVNRRLASIRPLPFLPANLIAILILAALAFLACAGGPDSVGARLARTGADAPGSRLREGPSRQSARRGHRLDLPRAHLAYHSRPQGDRPALSLRLHRDRGARGPRAPGPLPRRSRPRSTPARHGRRPPPSPRAIVVACPRCGSRLAARRRH